MIPKIIHYVWLGGPKTKVVEKCMASWRKHCPGYEIKEWNETNFDFSQNNYAREAYEAKKYAFASDYIRLWALYNYGGVYLDTDVEVLKPFDPLLGDKCFLGFEDEKNVAPGLVLGAEAGAELLADLLKIYEVKRFITDGGFDTTPNPLLFTELLTKKYGLVTDGSLQKIGALGLTVYPSEYFQPIDLKTDKLNVTANTYSIHHYAGTWLDPGFVKRREYEILYGKRKGLLLFISLHPVMSAKRFFEKRKEGKK